MTLKSKLARLSVAAAGALVLSTSSAQAAMIVYDPTSYAKLIEQARTALGQLEELKAQVVQGKALLDSLNTPSGVAALAAELDVPGVREVLPTLQQFSGDLDDLGALGERAASIRQAGRLHTPAKGDLAGQDLDAAGDRAARDLAVGEAVAAAGERRLAGLRTLQAAIDPAPNARAVLDLQARIGAEQAVIANEQMRLQGLAMAQAAEARLQTQRERERAAARRAARLERFREGF